MWPGSSWCARVDAMFNSDGMHVLDVQCGHRKLVITFETNAEAPCFGLPVLIVWLKRVWCCAEVDCPAARGLRHMS